MRYELKFYDDNHGLTAVAPIDAGTEKDAIEAALGVSVHADSVWLYATPDRALDGDASMACNITLLKKGQETKRNMETLSRFCDNRTQICLWADEFLEAIENSAIDRYNVCVASEYAGKEVYTLWTDNDGRFVLCIDHDIDDPQWVFDNEQKAYKFFDAYVKAMRIKED